MEAGKLTSSSQEPRGSSQRFLAKGTCGSVKRPEAEVLPRFCDVGNYQDHTDSTQDILSHLSGTWATQQCSFFWGGDPMMLGIKLGLASSKRGILSPEISPSPFIQGFRRKM